MTPGLEKEIKLFYLEVNCNLAILCKAKFDFLDVIVKKLTDKWCEGRKCRSSKSKENEKNEIFISVSSKSPKVKGAHRAWTLLLYLPSHHPTLESFIYLSPTGAIGCFCIGNYSGGHS